MLEARVRMKVIGVDEVGEGLDKGLEGPRNDSMRNSDLGHVQNVRMTA